MKLKYILSITLPLIMLTPTVEAASFFTSMIGIYKWIDSQTDNAEAVFIGDSITQGLNVNNVTSPAVNFGIVGATSAQSLYAMKNYQSIKYARIVVLAVGINDLRQSKKTDLFTNYAKILQAIPLKVRVIASGILPVINRKGQSSDADLLEANAVIKKLCLHRGRCEYVDNTNLPASGHISDGLHLNASGYAVWTANLVNALKISDHKWPIQN